MTVSRAGADGAVRRAVLAASGEAVARPVEGDWGATDTAAGLWPAQPAVSARLSARLMTVAKRFIFVLHSRGHRDAMKAAARRAGT